MAGVDSDSDSIAEGYDGVRSSRPLCFGHPQRLYLFILFCFVFTAKAKEKGERKKERKKKRPRPNLAMHLRILQLQHDAPAGLMCY